MPGNTMKVALATSLVALSLCAACNKPAVPIAMPAESHQVKLLRDFVAAINLKDPAQLRTFLTTHATLDVPLEDRIERISDLADQGAPFTIIGEPKEQGDSVTATLRDRQGIEVDVVFSTTGGTEPKMKSMMARPKAAPVSKLEWTDLSSLVKAVATASKSPAMSLTVVHGGKAETAVTGVRELGKDEKVGADEPFSIGSIGKPICSTVIALLIEHGKLRWDETLAEALPDVPMKEEYKSVTLTQLMQHRGGVPQDLGMRKPQIDAILKGETDPVKMRQAYAADILSRAPIGMPGEKMRYSNGGYALLSVVAERASGKAYPELVKSMVFEPLGLKHSYIGNSNLPDNHPSGHIAGPNGLEPVNFTGPMEVMFAGAGGGMWMSTADLAKFGGEHLKGLKGQDGLLKATTVVKLHEALPADGPGFSYGCGWGVETQPGPAFHGHNGSNGTMRAQLCLFPDLDLVVAAIVNAGGESEPTPGLRAALEVARRAAKN